MENCIFCKIIKKEMPAKIEYEDDQVMAFWDIKPATPTHILIVPKEHIQSANYLKEKNKELVGKLILVAVDLAKKKKIDQKGYRLVVNTGPWAGQIINHLHLHLLGPNARNPKS